MEGAFSSLRKSLFSLHLSQKNTSESAIAFQNPNSLKDQLFFLLLNMINDIKDKSSVLPPLSFISFLSLVVNSNAAFYFSTLGSKINTHCLLPLIGNYF